MKTCIYCGRTYPEDVRVCPACGLNLDQAPENVMEPIEIDVEPEEWIPPHQQTQETETTPPRQEQETPRPPQEQPQPPQRQPEPPREERAEMEQAAAQTLSPELMRMFRENQFMYIFRMLLLLIVALCFLVNNWLYNMDNTSNLIGMSLMTVAPGVIVGLWGIWHSMARLRKTPGELAAQVGTSSHGAFSLFSAHERIVLKAPVLGILLCAGALYAAFLILQNAPLKYIAHNLSMLGRIRGRNWWDALDKANGGIACSAMLLFCLSYPIRTIRLFMLKGRVTKAM